jgi:hypothetical protein
MSANVVFDVVLLEKVEIVHSRRRVTAINKNLQIYAKKVIYLSRTKDSKWSEGKNEKKT